MDKFTRDWFINNLREALAKNIATREIPYYKTYTALIELDIFGNWSDDDLFHRPVNEREVKDLVYDYYYPNGNINRPLQEVYPFLFR